MASSREFRKKLHRIQRLLIKEIIDGCPNCYAVDDVCDEHIDEVLEIATEPKKNAKVKEMVAHLKKG